MNNIIFFNSFLYKILIYTQRIYIVIIVKYNSEKKCGILSILRTVDSSAHYLYLVCIHFQCKFRIKYSCSLFWSFIFNERYIHHYLILYLIQITKEIHLYKTMFNLARHVYYYLKSYKYFHCQKSIKNVIERQANEFNYLAIVYFWS